MTCVDWVRVWSDRPLRRCKYAASATFVRGPDHYSGTIQSRCEIRTNPCILESPSENLTLDVVGGCSDRDEHAVLVGRTRLGCCCDHGGLLGAEGPPQKQNHHPHRDKGHDGSEEVREGAHALIVLASGQMRHRGFAVARTLTP